MDTNAQNTLVVMFQHVEIFFAMLDYHSNYSKTVTGFDISAYESVLVQYSNQRISDAVDQRRIKTALSLSNMNACGLIAFIEKERGKFGLNRGLLQTIQGLDSKRIRELGQPDLDMIYVQVKQLHDYFIPQAGAFDLACPDFQENLDTLIDTLQDAMGKMDHNYRALEGSSKRLSEILDSHDFNQLLATEQVRTALDEVSRISKRNIQPTLIFLNERAMVQDRSTMYLIRMIKESFEGTPLLRELATISTIEMRLLSYNEDIKAIRQRLYRYLEMDRQVRTMYNAIETKFNDLHTKVVDRLDTKVKGKSLTPEDMRITHTRIFAGLTNWNRSGLTGPLIQLPKHNTRAYVEEYIRTKLDNMEALDTNKRAPGDKTESRLKARKRRQRVGKIKKLMSAFQPSLPLEDVYQAIHIYLKINLKDYDLRDLYDALAFVKKGQRLKRGLARKELIHNNLKLTYIPYSIERKENHAV